MTPAFELLDALRKRTGDDFPTEEEIAMVRGSILTALEFRAAELAMSTDNLQLVLDVLKLVRGRSLASEFIERQ